MTLRTLWQQVERVSSFILRIVWVVYAVGLAVAVLKLPRLVNRAFLGDSEAWGELIAYVFVFGVLRWSYPWWRYGKRLQVWRRPGKGADHPS